MTKANLPAEAKRRPVRYLITVECSHTEPAGYSNWHGRTRTTERVLTHRHYETIETPYPHHAQQRAEIAARDLARRKTDELTTRRWDDTAKVWRVFPPQTLSAVRVAGVEPVKRFKIRKAARVPAIRKSESAWERAAILYAQWLASRDDIKLPTGHKVRVNWSGVSSKTRKSNRGAPVWERRICSVAWGHEEEVYNTRKDGRRGAWLYTQFVEELRIELPHWDWQPEMTEEHDCEIAESNLPRAPRWKGAAPSLLLLPPPP